MKLHKLLGALLALALSLPAFADADITNASQQSATPVAVETKPAPAPVPVEAKQPARQNIAPVRIPKSVPITTTGYQGGGAALPLPGVGVMPGKVKPELENNVIRVNSNRTEVISVSATLTNRIATPFANPKAILLDGGATVTADGQSLYVALDGSPDPLALYVTGSEPNDPVVSLTLMPQSLPPQTIVLQLEGLDKTVVGGGAAGREENPGSPIYTERLVSVLRSVALGKTPEGYVEARLPVAAADFGTFTAVPLARFSGASYDVYRYRLVTESTVTIELEEGAFASEGVRAVAFFPSALIAKNISTDVFVVADKKATVQGAR